MTLRFLQLYALASLASFALFVASARAEDEKPPEPSPAAAEMLKSMREKGLLSEEEYEELFRRQARYEAEQRAEYSLPGWLKDWTVGGDLRFRWDRIDYAGSADFPVNQAFLIANRNVDVTRIDTGNGTITARNDRYLLRMRLGVEKKLGDDFTAGVRIATSAGTSYGSGASSGGVSGIFTRSLTADPRSTNVALGDYFEPKGIYLDRAYLTWNPFFAKSLRMYLGKFANPFTTGANPAEPIIWDPDIQPEGAALKYGFDLLDDKVRLDTSAGYFVLDQIGSATIALPPTTTPGTAITIAPHYDSADPYMAGVQQAVDARPLDWLEANGRFSYYNLQHLNTGFVAAINDLGNTGAAVNPNPLLVVLAPSDPLFQGPRSRGKLEEIVFDGFLDFRVWRDWDLHLKPFGQYSQILTVHQDNEAWVVGGQIGIPNRVALTAGYAEIQRDGTIALFTDSDLFNGLTNVQGWYVTLEGRLTSFLRLRGAWMKSQILDQECLFVQSGQVSLCDFGLAANPSLSQAFTRTERDRERYQIDLMVDF